MPEVRLQPHRRDRLAEQRRLDVHLRELARREDEPVRETAQPVVHEEHRDERRPLDDEARHAPSQVGRAERDHPDREPQHDEVVRRRHAQREHHRGRCRDVGKGHPEAQAVPRAHVRILARALFCASRLRSLPSNMVGSVALALGLVVIGLIAAVVLPGAGWILLPILVIVAILVVVRAFAGGREATPKA